MIKKIIAAAITVLALSTTEVGAQKSQSASPGDFSKNPVPVAWNRELPRTYTIGYDSEKASIEGSKNPSPYLQPLDDKWTISERDAGKTRIFKNNYKIPFSWAEREAFLYVGSVSGAYDVIINGKYTAYNQNGSTPAEFNITALSKEGLNEVEIVVYSDYEAKVLTADPGRRPEITGKAHIISQPKIRIRDFTYSVNFEGTTANLELGVILKSHLLNPKSYRVFYRLLSPSGEEAASGYKDTDIEMRGEDTVRFFASLPNAQKWSHETPKTYTLLLKTQHEGRYGEYIAYNIGIRTLNIDDVNLEINSIALPISVTRYEIPKNVETAAEKLKELKSIGYNTIITDKPAPEYLYNLCDELGVYIIPQADINTSSFGESRTKNGNPTNDPKWKDAYTGHAVDLYYTSQNHPSVIGLSLASKSANGYNLYESYLALKNLEKQRPVIYLDAEGEWNSDAVSSNFKPSDPQAAGSRIILDIGKKYSSTQTSTVLIEVIDAQRGICRVHNNNIITDLEGEVHYIIKQGTRMVSKGTVGVNIPPQTTMDITLPTGKAKQGKPMTFDLKLFGNKDK